METQVAKILSCILHPLLIPTYAVLILLNLPLFLSFTLSMEAKIWLMALVFVFTFIMPVAIIMTMYYFKMISSPELEQPSQRTLPLIFSSASYIGLLYILRKSGLPDYFLYVIYGALFTLLTGLMINLVYKISLHTLAWGAAVALFVGIWLKIGLEIPAIIIVSILLAGLAGFARLKLNAHNPTQVYLGFATGASIILIMTFAL